MVSDYFQKYIFVSRFRNAAAVSTKIQGLNSKLSIGNSETFSDELSL